jgi:uncharacterized protein YbcI
VTKWTKRTIEAEIANAIVQVQREQQGRGPTDVKVHIIGEMVIVRSIGILTSTEHRLASTEEGRRLVKSARQELRNISHVESEAAIARVTSCKVLRSYGDLDVSAAEQMEVFVLDTDLERKLLRHELDDMSGIGPGRIT